MVASIDDFDPAALVLCRTSYVDSIQIQQTRRFGSDFVKYLARHCGWAIGPEEFPTYGGRVKNRLWLHQPDRAAFVFLSDKICGITQVQVALDLLCATPFDAALVQRHLRTHLVPSMLPYDRIEPFETTIYYGFTRPGSIGRKIATYSNRPSKLQRQRSCCHVELRIKGAASLRAAGLRTAKEVLGLDHEAFWRTQIRLVRTPAAEALGMRYVQAFMKNPNRRTAVFPFGGRAGTIRRVGHLLLRAAQDEDGRAMANDLIHFLRDRRPLGKGSVSDLFEPISSDWMLPLPQPGLWRANDAERDLLAGADELGD